MSATSNRYSTAEPPSIQRARGLGPGATHRAGIGIVSRN